MQAQTETIQTSKGKLWAGRILSAIPVLILILAGSMKLTRSAGVLQGIAEAGFSTRLAVPIGLLELACTLIYLIPRTSILGAILMTGFLGGATVTEVRVGNPSYFVTVLLGMMVWGGLYFRESRLRELIPLRK
jgi:DoxX-like family